MARRTRSVTLRIRTVQSGENVPPHIGRENLTPDAEDAVLDSLFGPAPEDETGPAAVELTTGAILEESEDGRLRLRYRESELSGMEGTTTEISFLPAEPTLVTIERSGTVRCALVLEPGRYHTGVYETPVLPLTVTTAAFRLENGIGADGGRMDVEYLLRIGGISAMRTHLTLDVVPHGGAAPQ